MRPYDRRIRKRIVMALERCGCTFDEEAVVPAGTGDEKALEQIQAFGNQTLLMPFHGHRDTEGNLVDGIGLFARLGAAAPKEEWRVLMPTTPFGRPGLVLRIDRLEPRLRQQIFVLDTKSVTPDSPPSQLTPLRAFLGR